jgi:hypothetical protein
MRRRPVSAALVTFAVVLGTSTVIDRHDPVAQSEHNLTGADLHVPVHLADPALATLLQPGDVISLMASKGSLGSPATTVAEHLRVITVSPTSNSGGMSHGALIVVATDATRAALLAGAAQTTLTVVIHPN